jgi:hypothetical protein
MGEPRALDRRQTVERLLELVASEVPTNQPVATSHGPLVTLYTGRKTVRAWPLDDPMIHYQSGRSLARFYLAYSAAEPERASPTQRARAVFASLRRLGVERLIVCERLELQVGDRALQRWILALELPVLKIDRQRQIVVVGLGGPKLDRLLAEK